jgi:hypothetical protein
LGPGDRPICCSTESAKISIDCDTPDKSYGPAYDSILAFAASESVWLINYLKAWNIATTNN